MQAASSASPSASEPGLGRAAAPAGVPGGPGPGRRAGEGPAASAAPPLPWESGELCAGTRVGAEGPLGRAAKPPGSGEAFGERLAELAARGWGGGRGAGAPPALLGYNGIGTAASPGRVRAFVRSFRVWVNC